jgi:hypothetical protein
VLLSTAPVRRLGVPEAPLRFGRADPGRSFSARHLFLAGRPAFELSLWCGTCPFLFQRQEGANATLSVGSPSPGELEQPWATADDGIVGTFGSLIPDGDYLPLLLEVEPELVAPHDEHDYFTHEQVSTWGTDAFWGLPENPRSFYYRTFETAVSTDEHLYEFVVPMVPPSWNDGDRVQHYLDLMADGIVPTAVALTTLDICQPAMSGQSTDYYGHWGLTHFLLDGHHKLEAAARAGTKVRLLALVSVDGSLARPDDVARLARIRRQDPAARPRGSTPNAPAHAPGETA